MKFLTILKCAFCPRWSCHARYQIGNRTYYSNLGNVSTECPKKFEKTPFYKISKNLDERIARDVINSFREKEAQKDNEEKEE